MQAASSTFSSSAARPAPSVGKVPFPSYRKGTDRAVFSTIHEESVNCAVWVRELPEGVEEVLEPWARAAGTTAAGTTAAGTATRFDRVVQDPAEFDPAVLAGISDPEVRDWLARDIAALAREFVRITSSARFRLAFGPLTGDQCRKFHCDFIRLRLITTYLGPGTEWLPDEAVCREELEAPRECPAEANGRIVRDGALVRHAGAGDVLLLKGERYPTRRPVVHRSPPIEASGQVRVVLALTTFDPAP
jgi:hypothetical protein